MSGGSMTSTRHSCQRRSEDEICIGTNGVDPRSGSGGSGRPGESLIPGGSGGWPSAEFEILLDRPVEETQRVSDRPACYVGQNRTTRIGPERAYDRRWLWHVLRRAA